MQVPTLQLSGKIDAGFQRRLQHALVARHRQFDAQWLDAHRARLPGLAFEDPEHVHFLCNTGAATNTRPGPTKRNGPGIHRDAGAAALARLPPARQTL